MELNYFQIFLPDASLHSPYQGSTSSYSSNKTLYLWNSLRLSESCQGSFEAENAWSNN